MYKANALPLSYMSYVLDPRLQFFFKSIFYRVCNFINSLSKEENCIILFFYA